ncbi:MAG: sulfatase-like hydrolase/transferase, partial [Gemmatimonadetes bacterium]|nr:sulfatase-like hydrolase/transferase [Gemmatimonadota bacterium]
RIFPATVLGLTLVACSGSPSGSTVLTADMPLHLEQHLDAATIVGSEVPADAPTVMEWHFDEPQEDWKPFVPQNPTIDPVEVTQLDDALRVTLTDGTRYPSGSPRGGLVLEVPDWDYEDLAHLVVRARTAVDFGNFQIYFNRSERADPNRAFEYASEAVPVISDGTVQTYRVRLDYFGGRPPPEEPIRQMALWLRPGDLASIDILSITLTTKVANYAEAGAASRTEIRNQIYRQALYTHTPGRVEYRVEIPEGGRLDFGMGVLREDVPVTFRVTAIPDGAGGGEPTTLFEEHYADKEAWGQRSVDLADFAGQTVTLGLEAESEDEGRVALWGAPTVTGAGQPPLPNVIFYVFDGGAADYMSIYGYNRRTTPTLERLAQEGVVFERAYSNSSWTLPSTASFMTSLQTSVTGGLNPVPAEAVTMAEHMHRAGYQTAVFTGNPNAGTLSELQRGVDVFREDWEDFSYFGRNNHKESSKYLHEGFWGWREDYPRQPFWAHFQTTDTHGDFPAPPPFGGLFVTADESESWIESRERLNEFGNARRPHSPAFDSTGINRTEFYTVGKGLYDEAMAHNDYRLGQLIDRLKAEGEWENTLLIIGGDHSIRAALVDMGLALSDSLPPKWSQRRPMLRPTVSRVPLMFVWPGHIEGGQRIDQTVSMIDVLPTLLDLLGLPPAEIAQGQSLAPLMMGRDGWEPRPVILDEFYVDLVTGELSGVIEVVDGRWGASLEINPDPDESPEDRRPVPLLLYDLWNDPMALWSLHEERPDLVQKYTAFLEDQFEAHMALSQFFTASGEVELTAEQLRTLRSLGYIQ